MRIDPTGTLFGYTYTNSTNCLKIVRSSDFSVVDLSFNGAEAISPSGHEFAANGIFGRSTSSGLRTTPIPIDHIGPSKLAFSREGSLLIWGTGSGTVFLLDIKELDRRLSLLSH